MQAAILVQLERLFQMAHGFRVFPQARERQTERGVGYVFALAVETL